MKILSTKQNQLNTALQKYKIIIIYRKNAILSQKPMQHMSKRNKERERERER